MTAATVTAQVAASLSSQLHALLAQLKTGLSIAGAKSFSVTFTAVQPGNLSLTVSTVAGKATTARTKHKKVAQPIKVATGQLTVTSAGKHKVTIKLTGAGRSALTRAAKAHTQLKLAVSESFAPKFNGQLLTAIRPTGTLSVQPRTKHSQHKKK